MFIYNPNKIIRINDIKDNNQKYAFVILNRPILTDHKLVEELWINCKKLPIFCWILKIFRIEKLSKKIFRSFPKRNSRWRHESMASVPRQTQAPRQTPTSSSSHRWSRFLPQWQLQFFQSHKNHPNTRPGRDWLYKVSESVGTAVSGTGTVIYCGTLWTFRSTWSDSREYQHAVQKYPKISLHPQFHEFIVATSSWTASDLHSSGSTGYVVCLDANWSADKSDDKGTKVELDGAYHEIWWNCQHE